MAHWDAGFSPREGGGLQDGSSTPSRAKGKYVHTAGDITYTVSREFLETVKFAVDSSGEFLQVRYKDKSWPVWPSRDTARPGDVLVAVDGRSTLQSRDFPKILSYLNVQRNRTAYKLTFRLPQVALDMRLPMSSRTQFDPKSGNLQGYLYKLGLGNMFAKPKWEFRYFILDPAARQLRRYKAKDQVITKRCKVIELGEVAKVTENIEQPAADPDSTTAVQFAGSSFVVSFDIVLKTGVARSFVCNTPEDCRVWVATLAQLIGQTVMTDVVPANVPLAAAGSATAAAGGLDLDVDDDDDDDDSESEEDEGGQDAKSTVATSPGASKAVPRSPTGSKGKPSKHKRKSSGSRTGSVASSANSTCGDQQGKADCSDDVIILHDVPKDRLCKAGTGSVSSHVPSTAAGGGSSTASASTSPSAAAASAEKDTNPSNPSPQAAGRYPSTRTATSVRESTEVADVAVKTERDSGTKVVSFTVSHSPKKATSPGGNSVSSGGGGGGSSFTVRRAQVIRRTDLGRGSDAADVPAVSELV